LRRRLGDRAGAAYVQDVDFPQSGVIQVVQDADRAGRSLLTLVVDDLKEDLGSLRERGLDPGTMDDTTSDKVLFAR
jgi:hypothetical protein